MTANAMRCDDCNINFADRQPGTVCPKCYRELSRITVTDNMPPPTPHPSQTAAALQQEGVDRARAASQHMTTDNMPPLPGSDDCPWSSGFVRSYARAHAEQETKALRALLQEVLPFVTEAQTWDGHTSDTPNNLIKRIDEALKCLH